MVDEGVSVIQAERGVIGWNHAEVGEGLLEKWNFQREIFIPIGSQYEPTKSRDYKKVASMMNVSHFLVSALGQSYGRDAMAVELSGEALDMVGMAEADLQMTIIEVQEKIEQIKSQLQLA